MLKSRRPRVLSWFSAASLTVLAAWGNGVLPAQAEPPPPPSEAPPPEAPPPPDAPREVVPGREAPPGVSPAREGVLEGGPGGALASHGGYEGVWLRGERVEAFVAVSPRVRVMVLRPREAVPGGPGVPGAGVLLRQGEAVEVGIRSAFMEPGQVPASYEPANQAGEVVARGPGRVEVATGPGAASGLALVMRVEVVEEAVALPGVRGGLPGAGVRVTHRFVNHGGAARELAAWSIVSLPRAGFAVVPFGVEPRQVRRLVLPWWARLPQPGLRAGFNAGAFDFEAAVNGGAFKFGAITDAGWVAAIRGRGGIVSLVPRQPGAAYPEGGANVTVFVSGDPDHPWAEIEQVGPLRRVEPGGSIELTETLLLLSFDAPPPPNDPDAARAAVEAQLPR